MVKVKMILVVSISLQRAETMKEQPTQHGMECHVRSGLTLNPTSQAMIIVSPMWAITTSAETLKDLQVPNCGAIPLTPTLKKRIAQFRFALL